jgi:hypothetical protein
MKPHDGFGAIKYLAQDLLDGLRNEPHSGPEVVALRDLLELLVK